MNELILGDCLEIMKEIPDGSVDMVLCDLPYGTTQNAWDSVIPLNELWAQYKRITKGVIVLTAAQPFTSLLISNDLENFWHNWIWIKPRPTGFQNAKKQPLRSTEDVVVFMRGRYNPQGLIKIDKVCKNSKSAGGGNIRDDISKSSGKGLLRTKGTTYIQEYTNYPRNVLEFGLDEKTKLHPTQKPVALFEYLIKTYTNEGETVLDNCAGSGTTAIAAINTNRNWICIEKDPTYHEIASKRIEEHKRNQSKIKFG